MKLNSINRISKSAFVNMGPIRLRQPLPSQNIDLIDPFVLLHHYGPYKISEDNNPFDLGPHPHRGFEPVTFLFQGEQLHKDSLGHESVVEAGDVQWTTAGRGIIHSERPTDKFVKKGGIIEGIQLWLNLPAEKKMIPANYQHGKSDDFAVVESSDQLIKIKVVAGELGDAIGLIRTQTPVNAFMIEADAGGATKIQYAQKHRGLIYLLKGTVVINSVETLALDENQLIEFNQKW
jgi:redox-sensitive bicupin YhaK (pirin superfamily)